jgi:hypothetical protein
VFAQVETGSHHVLRAERGELFASAEEESVVPDKKGAHALSRKRRESSIDFAFGARLQDVQLQSQRTCRVLRPLHLHRGGGIVCGHQQCDQRGFRHQLMQYLQPLFSQLTGIEADTGNVAAGTTETCDETELYRIAAQCEDHWYRRRGRLRRDRRVGAAGGNEYRDVSSHQFVGQPPQPFVVTFGPTIFDPDVPALDISSLGQAPPERRNKAGPACRRLATKESDGGTGGILRVNSERRRKHARCGLEQESPTIHC